MSLQRQIHTGEEEVGRGPVRPSPEPQGALRCKTSKPSLTQQDSLAVGESCWRILLV